MSPGGHRYSTPLVVRPGDELKMNCQFSSLGRDRTTVDGEGSYDEMCYGILTYYPASSFQHLEYCFQWKDLDFCDFFDGNCSLGDINNSSHPVTADIIQEVRRGGGGVDGGGGVRRRGEGVRVKELDFYDGNCSLGDINNSSHPVTAAIIQEVGRGGGVRGEGGRVMEVVRGGVKAVCVYECLCGRHHHPAGEEG